MSYDDQLALIHAQWAIKEWRKLPMGKRLLLLPCLKAARRGFRQVQREWIKFVADSPGLGNWEAAELGSVIRYLVQNVDENDREKLIAETPQLNLFPCDTVEKAAQ